jgi:hypothetical protein
MKLSRSWKEANCASAQEHPNILWNLNVYYHVQESPPLFPILSQIKPTYTTLSCLTKIHLNIIHPPTSWVFLVVSFLLALSPICIPPAPLPHSCCMPCPSHPPWLDHNYIWQGVQVMRLFIMQFSPPSCHFLSSVQIFASAPCFQTPSVYVP